MNETRTQWFSCRPPQKGVWEIENRIGDILFSDWDGFLWGVPASTVESAEDFKVAYTFDIVGKWRGLAFNPKGEE